MITCKGIGISEGLARGKLFVFRSAGASCALMNTAPLPSSDGRGLSLSAEECRELFLTARNLASAELIALSEELRAKGQDIAADLMDTHAALAEDPDFEDEVLAQFGVGEPASAAVHEAASADGTVSQGGTVADVIATVTEAGETFAAMFEEMEGDMRLRGADIRDVAARICRAILRTAPDTENGESTRTAPDAENVGSTRTVPDAENVGSAQTVWNAEDEWVKRTTQDGAQNSKIMEDGFGECTAFSGPSLILAAKDLSPSETASLDRTKISGIALSGGSAAGHMAILTRAFGIPAVAGLGREFEEICEAFTRSAEDALSSGEYTLLLDGTAGIVVIDPDEETAASFEARISSAAAEKERLEAFRGRETLSGDGRKVKLLCNISGPEDVPAVKQGDGEGIGLFRSEFLFLGRDAAPSEEEQYEAYRAVLSQIPGEVTIRTMDIGADKQVSWLELPAEENPAPGLRGLRLSLARPDLFRTQLRALYRASVYGKLRIMFPMVISLWELEKAKELCREVRTDLAAEGLPFCEVPLGIMIETPAAALASDLLAPSADFFSIGTNDLTQYTLAVDRGAAHLSDYADPRHEAVFRLLELTIRNAHAAGISVSICGELAADRTVTERLVGMGIDGLSVAPGAVLRLREAISLLP